MRKTGNLYGERGTDQGKGDTYYFLMSTIIIYLSMYLALCCVFLTCGYYPYLTCLYRCLFPFVTLCKVGFESIDFIGFCDSIIHNVIGLDVRPAPCSFFYWLLPLRGYWVRLLITGYPLHYFSEEVECGLN